MTQEEHTDRDAEGILRFERNFLSGILETTSAFIIVLDTQGRILRLNRAIEKLTGFTILETVGSYIWDILLFPEEVQDFKALFDQLHQQQFPYEFQGRLKAKHGQSLWVYWTCNAIAGPEGSLDFVISTGIDMTQLRRAEEEREKLILELQQALASVKTLKGLLPICASCKKIRDDRGYWRMVEDYIREYSEVEFSHGICPPCAKMLYPQYYREEEQK